MLCPFCRQEDTKVIDSRLVDEGARVRRRRQCLGCQERFTTFEYPELTLPRVIKRDGQRCAFDKEKCRRSMLKALEKRPVSMEAVDQAINQLIHRLQAKGDSEVSTTVIGELVMSALKQLDQVAYIRFASVYRSFQDVSAFQDEINKLKQSANSSEPHD